MSDQLLGFAPFTVNPNGSLTPAIGVVPLDFTFGVGGPKVLHFDQSPFGSNTGLIDFAPGLAGKQAQAGQMAYQAFGNHDALDIVGAGTATGSRNVSIYDNLTIGFDGNLTGQLNLRGVNNQLEIFPRAGGGGGMILYVPSGGQMYFYDTFSSAGQFMAIFARFGQVGVFDTWGELWGAGSAANGRGHLGLCGTSNGAAFLGSGIYNDTGGWQRETVNGSGMFYVNNSAPQVYNICAGGGGTLQLVCTFPGCGSFAVDANGSVHALAFPASSDERLKRNIKTIESDEALEIIHKLRPVRFKWSRRAIEMGRVHTLEARKVRTGFIAQEVEEHIPEVIERWTHPENEATKADDGDGEPFRGIDYSRLVPLLVGAIQELTHRLEVLESAN